MKHWAILCVALLVVVLGVLFTGCEVGNDLGPVPFRIEPSEVTLADIYVAAAFRAVGGKPPYTWSVSDPTVGNITGSGDIVTYTRTTKVGVNTVIVKDGHSWIAEAHVIQPTNEVVQLEISPSTATVSTNGGTQVFYAKGGSGNYLWGIYKGDGTLSDLVGPSTVYTVGQSLDSTIIYLDDGYTIVYAEIGKSH